jgi:nicotinate-nucleotide adenylyltransferase
MNQSIGILGGSFNPVHQGHLILAQDALERFELDEVVFVPAFRPPHKEPSRLAETRHRLAMLEMALEGDPRFSVSAIEGEREGPSYSIDTVRELRAQRPDAAWSFIIGADTLPELHTWKDIETLLGLVRVVTLARPGWPVEAMDDAALRLPPPWPERLRQHLAVGHEIGISSTEIRMRVAEGLSIKFLVPDAVGMYIAEHGLYRA